MKFVIFKSRNGENLQFRPAIFSKFILASFLPKWGKIMSFNSLDCYFYDCSKFTFIHYSHYMIWHAKLHYLFLDTLYICNIWQNKSFQYKKIFYSPLDVRCIELHLSKASCNFDIREYSCKIMHVEFHTTINKPELSHLYFKNGFKPTYIAWTCWWRNFKMNEV